MMKDPLILGVSRRDALRTKIEGKELALMDVDDLQKRIDLIVRELSELAVTLSELRRRYGPRTIVEQLDNRELERVLNVMHAIVRPAQMKMVE